MNELIECPKKGSISRLKMNPGCTISRIPALEMDVLDGHRPLQHAVIIDQIKKTHMSANLTSLAGNDSSVTISIGDPTSI